MYVFTGEYLLMALDLASIHKRWGFFFIIVKDGDVACLSSKKRMPAGCRIIYCRPLLLELTLSEPLTLDKEVRMQEEWHRDERKCALVILARDLLLLDLDIIEDDRPSVAVASPSRIPLP